ncbi:hypothetical protein B0H63DRAFT_397379 [Podospora didyma]|uniref:DUF676 domain-containing protein n=1 Tax=Podospora didyma TaxID=330526 RepID=A0AAE0NG12_9PEZI|nr:hypothetical protein B0H63DRAFT_397379 [Podospora didyma]
MSNNSPTRSRSRYLSTSRKRVFWPYDLLRHDLPNARILTYGYDTHIKHMFLGEQSNSSVYDVAWNFLVALEAERRSNPSRPVIFVAHSLGGIVVKEMLRRSSGCQLYQPHLHDIFLSTRGIVFFGIPHGGADPRGMAHKGRRKAH